MNVLVANDDPIGIGSDQNVDREFTISCGMSQLNVRRWGTCWIGRRRSLLACLAVIKVSCEPSSISRFAREEETCDETVAIAVFRKTNGIVSSSLGARRSLFAKVLDDATDSRHPI